MNEGYEGIKFNVTFLKETAPSHSQLDELKKWCTVFHEKGLAPPYPGGSYGNLSFRTNRSSFIITGTCMGLKENLHDDCFVEVTDVDFEYKNIFVYGLRNPSSESMLHAAIYKFRPDVNAIFHGHCEVLLHNAITLGVPETAEEKPYGTIELVDSVLEIAGSTDFLIIKNHGFLTFGKSMNDAGELSLAMLAKVM